MPGVTPLRPDDVRSARAWAAFVADDAAATAPASLEARVLHAARAAIAQKQRDEAERLRRRWFAGISAIAASLLAAAAWSLVPRGSTASPAAAPAATTPASAAAAALPPTPESAPPQKPLPMTNVEAGRVLATPPQVLLASRPFFHVLDGAGPVGTPGGLRARSFAAPAVEPALFERGQAAASRLPHMPSGGPGPTPLGHPPGTLAGTASEAWSSRGDKPVFDPEAGEVAPPAPVYRLEHAAPVPPAGEDPPAPPK